MPQIHIPPYLAFLPWPLLERMQNESEPVPGLPGVALRPGLQERFPTLETPEALGFIADLYRTMYPHLRTILEQRQIDRAFLDRETQACVQRNVGKEYRSPEYETILGKADATGKIAIGPLPPRSSWTPVTIPPSMAGEQVTLFGPPDDPRMSINAMNALHRRLPEEPPLVAELLDEGGQVPRWGADNEDSMTPLFEKILGANDNLLGCYNRTLRFTDPERGRLYEIAPDRLSKPIKRIPGFALPDAHHLVDGNPLPLHLLDFGLQFFHNWDIPEALVFYIPKIETEDEAAYLRLLLQTAETRLQTFHPEYKIGSIRLFVVFENPRAIFRIREIAEALAPYFVGGSLGWHDFLASTARLFRFDPNYRIPVKADPDIVINRIKESHLLLARALDPIGGVKIGGMYGVLYEEGNPLSFEVCMVGYIKDVITQLKRGLDGFWVAHPNFVRIGLALVQAWRRRQKNPDDPTLRNLILALVTRPAEQEPLLAFVFGPDIPGLSLDDPLYLRGVLAADLAVSNRIANDHPDEIRYNIFQALQYLADWLRGNGCVALPAAIPSASGEKVFVRIMDDLATTERSRWELWAEIFHQRVSLATFESLLAQEIAFIRQAHDTPLKRVQIPWTDDNDRWYPIAVKLLRQLVTDPQPVEFVTELLLPFTLDPIRLAPDPWAAALSLCPGHYRDEG